MSLDDIGYPRTKTGLADFTSPTEHRRPPTLVIAGRSLTQSPVFDTYWRFAAERQAIYEARLAGRPGPWTTDPILSSHRFTNCFRAADRVSQYLIRRVIYSGSQEFQEVVFRTLLFKFFNKIETWELLQSHLGTPAWQNFDIAEYNSVLSAAFGRGVRLYSAAYVMAPPRMGAERKHTNHLLLLQRMMRAGIVDELINAHSMKRAYDALCAHSGIGQFLGFQFVVDLNYSDALRFDEMDFVVAGPGARDGVRKCFGPQSEGIESAVIRYMAEHQEDEFRRRGLIFRRLLGRRPLQLVDCQNLFCEVDKYARVAHPLIAGISGRSRIKRRFAVQPVPLTAWFPPKWELS